MIDEKKLLERLSGTPALGKVLDGIIRIIESQPKVGEWISCSERLPECDKDVLICFDYRGHRSIELGSFWNDGKAHCDSDEYLTLSGRKEREAVAWQPLPEEYHEPTDKKG